MSGALHDPPAVIIGTKARSRTKVKVARVNRRADFVHGNPFPCEFHLGNIALPGYASDGEQFAASGKKNEGLFFRFAGSDEALEGIDARRGQRDLPTRGRIEAARANGIDASNPAAMLQLEIFGRKIVGVGYDAGVQVKLLRSAEGVEVAIKSPASRRVRKSRGEQEINSSRYPREEVSTPIFLIDFGRMDFWRMNFERMDSNV